MKVYCKVDGVLQIYAVNTDCHIEAISTVRSAVKYASMPILALVRGREGIGGA